MIQSFERLEVVFMLDVSIKKKIEELVIPLEDLRLDDLVKLGVNIRVDDLLLADIINSEGATNTIMKQAYIEKSISELFRPYMRSGSKIVYYCSSKDRYKARVPVALRIPGIPLPQTAKTEKEMWDKLYQYFVTYLKTNKPGNNINRQKRLSICIMALFAPYIRKSDDIIYYVASKDCYKIYIPTAFRIDGVTVPQTAKTKDDLLEKVYSYLKANYFENTDVQDMITKVDGGADGDTFYDIYKVWVRVKKGRANISSGTTKRDETTFKCYFIDDPILKMRITDIDVQTIYDFLHKCIYGVRPDITGKILDLEPKLTRAEFNNIKTITNGVFQQAITLEMVTNNPSLACDSKNFKFKGKSNEGLAYTDIEREKVLAYIDSLPFDKHNCYTIGIGLMFCLDVRIGEVKAFSWDDVNWDNRTINVYREVVKKYDDAGKGRQVEVDRTKGGEDCGRQQRLTDRAIKYLEIAKAKNPNGHHILLSGWGNCFYTNKFNGALKKVCEAAGVKYMSSHKIRFWSVGAQGRQTTDLGTIMYNSGHKNKRTTLHYMRQTQRDIENEKIWDKIFN